MVRFFTSLIVTVVIVAVVVIAWAPTAKSQGIDEEFCDDFCQTQTICMCAKLLGGSLRLTQCVIAPSCQYQMYYGGGGNICDCSSATPVCKPWEFPLVAQQLPFEIQACGPICDPC